MDKSRKREMLQAYREEKRPAGIFALRCAATGQAWVGTSKNIGQQQNSVWFTLKLGSHPNKALQAVFKAQGADAFAYEVLEEVDGSEMSALGLTDALKAKQHEWRQALNADAVVG
ncbi:GIY-YIG nuclease family protein [Caulobacter sp. KR2-114]|uniref:GIY-YIG nuclease family protein n=1 Tax=Caulobacter sp. KR2-114 TaxID=3400912 RepID=UPI003C078373